MNFVYFQRLCDWVAYDIRQRENHLSTILKYVKKDVSSRKLKECLSRYAEGYAETVWETWKTVCYEGDNNELFRCRTYAVVSSRL